MSRQFNLEKYLKENRILGQSGISLLREQQEKDTNEEVVYETSYGDYTEQPGNLRDALGDLFQTAYTAGVQGKSDFPTYLIDDALDLMKNSSMDLSEQEEEVEDVEDIEGGEEEIEEPLDTEEPISDDEEELQDTLTKAYNQAEKIGDTKLTQQISNTITYYVKTLLRNQ